MGAMLAKPLVLLLCSYLFWIFGHIDGVAGSRVTVLAIVGALAALFLFLLHRHGDEIIPWVRRHWRLLLVGEVLFLAAYGIWLAVVSQSPAITNTEKPMDFAFLNAILQAETFPPGRPMACRAPHQLLLLRTHNGRVSYQADGHLLRFHLQSRTSSGGSYDGGRRVQSRL